MYYADGGQQKTGPSVKFGWKVCPQYGAEVIKTIQELRI